MAYLPLANLMHYKLRSALSAAGIGIGVCMLLTLSGLSRGTLNEIADRWEAVDADLILCPRGWGENLAAVFGVGVADRQAAKVKAEHADLVQDAVPAFLWQVRLAGQEHTAVGVDPDQWSTLAGERALSQGRIFDPNGDFARWIVQRVLGAEEGDDSNTPLRITPEDLRAHGGLELVIDERLAKKGRFRLNDEVETANHTWRIVGIVPAGGMARLYMPRRTAQFLFGSGILTRSTLVFVKLRAGTDTLEAARRIGGASIEAVPLRQYRDMLQRKFGSVYLYVYAVNTVAMVIAFLFILVTLYSMVLQRTRQIAVLKSLGATRGGVLRGVLTESLLLTAAGTAAGVPVSLLVGWLIQTFTLSTVTITWAWVGIALAAAAVGALAAGLYPAWRAIRVDVVEALTLE